MTATSTLTLPVFYTCTTATPNGPPLEIAWGSLAFETYVVICGSHMIRRPPHGSPSSLATLPRYSPTARPVGPTGVRDPAA
jgi:hypothetical protein